jgi:hypothetical protein
VGEQGEGDVPVPGVVAADLVLVETDLVLGGLKAFLDGPAGSGDANQVLVGGAGWACAQVVGQLRFDAGAGLFLGEDLAADQQPASPPGGCMVGGVERGHGPVVEPFTLGAGTGAATLPGLQGCPGDEVIGPPRPTDLGDVGVEGQRDGLVAGYRDDVADAVLLAPGAEAVVLPVGLVRGDPGGGDSGVERPAEHGLGQGGLRRELDLVGHRRRAAPLPIVGPRPGVGSAAGEVPGGPFQRPPTEPDGPVSEHPALR